MSDNQRLIRFYISIQLLANGNTLIHFYFDIGLKNVKIIFFLISKYRLILSIIDNFQAFKDFNFSKSF